MDRDDRRSVNMDAAVDVCDAADDERSRGGVGIRLPRGQLRGAEHPQRRTKQRTEGTEGTVTTQRNGVNGDAQSCTLTVRRRRVATRLDRTERYASASDAYGVRVPFRSVQGSRPAAQADRRTG